MSGGGGGIIIIHRIAQSEGVPPEDAKKLHEIADRSVVRCSMRDALSVLRIVWRLIR